MRERKKHLLCLSAVLAGILLVAGAIGIVGCSPTASADESDQAAATEATAETADEAAEAATDAAAEPAAEAGSGEMLSLAEYQELCPLQTESWLRLRDGGGKSMGSMDENFRATLEAAFGMNGVPLYCGSCHNADYKNLLAERGDEKMAMTDTDAGLDIEYMGCGVCHTSDLEAGVTANTSFWPTFISQESWEKNIDQDDAVCGQCHMLEPSSAYMLPEYRGTVDIYKYGVDADSVYKAMMEAWDDNPIEITQLMIDNGFQVGATRVDEETGALIVGDNNKPILEMYQGSTHQQMGLTCTDCHMVETTAEDGTTYTDHYACDPLKNEVALEKCLTCHKSQGVESTEAMVDFVEGKQDELAQAQQAFHADVLELHDLLADAVSNGDVDDDTLKAAQDAYTQGVFYYQFQAQLTSDLADQGRVASHNAQGTYAVIEKGDQIVTDAIATLK